MSFSSWMLWYVWYCATLRCDVPPHVVMLLLKCSVCWLSWTIWTRSWRTCLTCAASQRLSWRTARRLRWSTTSSRRREGWRPWRTSWGGRVSAATHTHTHTHMDTHTHTHTAISTQKRCWFYFWETQPEFFWSFLHFCVHYWFLSCLKKLLGWIKIKPQPSLRVCVYKLVWKGFGGLSCYNTVKTWNVQRSVVSHRDMGTQELSSWTNLNSSPLHPYFLAHFCVFPSDQRFNFCRSNTVSCRGDFICAVSSSFVLFCFFSEIIFFPCFLKRKRTELSQVKIK